MRYVLWVLQVLLMAQFLFAGGIKQTLPAEQISSQFGFPALFIRFIGICELLGAIGLVVPSVTRIKPWLTPLAALGLVIIMAGATVSTLVQGYGAMAGIPAALGLIALFVAYGRWKLVPIPPR